MRVVDPIKHQEKRDAILLAARSCFEKCGFRGASVADICAATRVSPGVLYHYFSSKEAIIDAMAEFDLLATVETLTQMAQRTNALNALLTSIRRKKSSGPHRRPQLALEILAEAGRNEVIAKIVRRHGRTVRGLLSKYIRQGQLRGQIDTGLDADEAAALLFGMSQGMRCLAITDPSFAEARGARIMHTLVRRLLEPRNSRG